MESKDTIWMFTVSSRQLPAPINSNITKKTVAVQNPKKNPLRNIQLLCTVFTIQIYIRIDMLILNSVFLPIYSIFKAKAIFRLKKTLVREKKSER